MSPGNSHAPWRAAVWIVPGIALFVLGIAKITNGTGAAAILAICGVSMAAFGCFRGVALSRDSHSQNGLTTTQEPALRSRRAVRILVAFIAVLYAVAMGAGVLYDPHAGGSAILVHVLIAAGGLSCICLVLAPFIGVAGAFFDSKRESRASRNDE
jgi:hypothetical protein